MVAAYVAGVSCPSATQCTVGDGFGGEVTFDPRVAGSAAKATPKRLYKRGGPGPGQLLAVDCPTRTECVAVTRGSKIYTFNPIGPLDVRSMGTAGALGWLSCPSASQRTGVEAYGSEQITFNPRSLRVQSRSTVGRRFSLEGVSRPTSSQCTAVQGDGPGEEMTFNPRSPSAIRQSVLEAAPKHGNAIYMDVDCPSVMLCVGTDGLGREITFDPRTGQHGLAGSARCRSPRPADRGMAVPGAVTHRSAAGLSCSDASPASCQQVIAGSKLLVVLVRLALQAK